MKSYFEYRGSTFVLLVSLFFVGLGGCSRLRNQSGQIFVITAGRENVKMGLVGVHILTDEQLKRIAAPLLARHQIATEKYNLHKAQCARDRERLAQFGLELQSMVPVGLKISVIDTLELEILERRESLLASDRRELVDPLLGNGVLAEEFARTLPPPNGKTDADGLFTVRAGSGDWLIAFDSRLVGSSEEKYLWAELLTTDNVLVLVSNDSLVRPSALVPFLCERSGLQFTPQELKALDVSAVTEAWIKTAKDSALSARVRAIADELDAAKSRYKLTLDSAHFELLSKWGGEAWRKLQVDVASISAHEDARLAAAHYRDATIALDRIIDEVNSKEDVDQKLTEKKRIAAQELMEQKLVELVEQQQRRVDAALAAAELAKKKALAEKVTAQEAEAKAKKSR